MKNTLLIAAVFAFLLCLNACENSSNDPAEESPSQSVNTSIYDGKSEQKPVGNSAITKKELSPDEIVFYRRYVPASSWEIILCTSAEEKYSIYVTRTYMTDENRLYTKMELVIPSDIEYDDYKLLPVFMPTGGSGGAMILIEFSTGETKSYYAFEANLAEYEKAGWSRFFGPITLMGEEINEILKEIEEKEECYN